MNYNFTTKRLTVKEWHSFQSNEYQQPDLETVVEEILTPDVTKRLPVMWRGSYDKNRAKGWIEGRDSESKTLLAVEKETQKAIGIINFFNVGDRSKGIYLRLGYMLSTVMWNKGFATEFVNGFMYWCKENNIATVLAGVDPDNIASIRVLEKNKFRSETTDGNGIRLLFEYNILHNEG